MAVWQPQQFGSRPLSSVMAFATLAGDTSVVLALLSALHWRRPLAVSAVPATLLVVALLVHIPKPLISAPRPWPSLGATS